MPYKSDAQRRYFHAAEGRGDIPRKTVAEFDQASKGKKLPEHAKGKDMAKRSSKHEHHHKLSEGVDKSGGHAMHNAPASKHSPPHGEHYHHPMHGAAGSHEHTRHANKGHVAHHINEGAPHELEAYHGGGHDGYTHKK